MFRSLSILIVGAALCTAALATQPSERSVRAALEKLAPGATIDAIKPSALPGLFEVTVNGAQIVYVSADGRYFVQGLVFDAIKQQNLTEISQAALRKKLMRSVSTAERIVFSPSDQPVKHRVAVFTDVDCGYCRKLHNEIDQYNALGIEIQYLAWPRAGMGSENARKLSAVWCAADPKAALTLAKSGQDPGSASCANPVEKELQLGMQLGVNGTPTMVLEDGTLLPTYLPAADLAARLAPPAK